MIDANWEINKLGYYLMENSHSNPERKQFKSATLTLAQYQATELLSIGKSEEEVAQLLRIEATIIEQWQQNPKFAAALNMLRVALSDSSGNTEKTEKSEPTTTLVDISRF